MRRFTILGLMLFILAVAISVTALRNADEYWAGGLILGTALLIATAALGAFYHSGRRRASRLGFTIFAGGYFILAFLGLSDQNLNKLPTSWLLLYVHQRVSPPQTFNLTYAGPPQPPRRVATVASNISPAFVANAATPTPPMQITLTAATTVNSSARWTALVPGAANYDEFSAVGHCLFALLAGLLGITLARRYEARQERDERSGEPTSRDVVAGADG
jgi:hypothetical protein